MLSIKANGTKQSTNGSVDVLNSREAGVIEHNGNTKIAMASYIGLVTVSGLIIERAFAGSSGEIFGHGDTRTVEANSAGSVALVGNPNLVVASDYGSVLVFGQPRKTISRNHGLITIVTEQENFQPTEVETSDNGRIRIITPGVEKARRLETNELHHKLGILFPRNERLDPLYVAYSGLLRGSNRDEYLVV